MCNRSALDRTHNERYLNQHDAIQLLFSVWVSRTNISALLLCREPDTEACSKRCESMHSCACSYYQPGSRFCTLMAGDVNEGMEAIAPACRPWDFLEGAMALEKDAALSNHVSVVCAREDLDVSSGSTASLGFAENAFTA